MFWNTLVELCNNKGVSPNFVAKELGITSGTVTSWKKGGIPRDTTLRKIADYFGVTVDELLGRKPMEGQDDYIKPMTPEARLLVSGVDRMPEEDRKKALNIMCTVFDQYKNYFEGNDAE
jgi:transcriptional regulator with XRE-family HTH domain